MAGGYLGYGTGVAARLATGAHEYVLQGDAWRSSALAYCPRSLRSCVGAALMGTGRQRAGLCWGWMGQLFFLPPSWWARRPARLGSWLRVLDEIECGCVRGAKLRGVDGTWPGSRWRYVHSPGVTSEWDGGTELTAGQCRACLQVC